MVLDFNDEFVGWIPDPDNAETTNVFDQALDGVTAHYARYRISHGRASVISPVTIVTVDGGGDIELSYGNEIDNLIARPEVGGKIRLTWIYNAIDQPVTPTGWNVYIWDGITWVNEDSDTLFANRGRYTWLSDELSDAERFLWKVSTYRTVAGTDYESPGLQAIAEADSTGPPAVVGIVASGS